MPKPFEPRELSLRIANILKRAQPAPTSLPETVRFGEFVFHLARGELRQGGETVHLTDREREMLRILAECHGETVPRQALAGNGAATNERAVDVQVNRLRRKIERDPANPLIVQTVRGIGYRLMIVAMTSLDLGFATLRTAAGRLRRRLDRGSPHGSTA